MCNTPSGMSHYLGSGKDGWVFRMFDPDDMLDRSLDRYCVKIWNDSFTHRVNEIDIHSHVTDREWKLFSTPSVIHVDYDLGCFVMEVVEGGTAFGVLMRRKLRLSSGLYDDVCGAFKELNNGGVYHCDPHLGNFMFTDLEFEEGSDVVVEDAVIWIIDFGRSSLSRSFDDVGAVRGHLRNDSFVQAVPT